MAESLKQFLGKEAVPIFGWTQGVPVEDQAMQQLKNIASLPFIHKHVAVMPDVHLGKGATIGSVIPTKGAIVPAAVGVDLGCGMMAVRTSIRAEHLPDSLAEIRSAIEKAVPHGRTTVGKHYNPSKDRGLWYNTPEINQIRFKALEGGLKAILEKQNDKLLNRAAAGAEKQLGTLGTGNHFIEICLDESNDVWVMLHSGSRGIGNRIATHFIEKAQELVKMWFVHLPDADLAYLPQGIKEFDEYIEAVQWAQRFAMVNREIMMENAINALRKFFPDLVTTEEAVNCHHNYVEMEVTVQVVKTYRLRSYLRMAYPAAMETRPALSHEVWEQTPPKAQAYIRALEARVATLEGMMQALQDQLNQTSRNSSRPPSSDPPQSERSRRPRSTRRRGGQPGHPGHTRPLVPVDEVDEVVVLKPEQCTHCQAPLLGDDPKPWRHQVIELPPIKPVVTEYQWHQLVCSACGEVTRAPWPEGVPSGTYGLRVQATVALYTGSYRLSKRTTQQMMDDVFGVPMSVGTISQLEHATTTAVAAPVEAARTYVHEQAVAHLDETSWRQGGKRAWLWVAVTRLVTVFVVRMSRGGQVARELLGETFAGILVTDRYSAYNWYPVRWRQVCWAHLLRDFEAMRDRGGRSEEIGRALLAQAHQMFTWWHRVREGTLKRSTFRSYMTPLRREVERLLEVGSRCGVPKTAGTCRDILKRREALWTFVQVEGVEPTNNTAERSIRPGVLWRKGSFGTQSAEGSHFVESMMTVVATLKQQQRNLLEYLTAACEAALRGEAAPSLLPASDQKSQAVA